MNANGLKSVEQVAGDMGVSPHTIRAWVQQRRIPYIKAGRRILFDPLDIENFIKSHKVHVLNEK
jgi:excisionase family DNA binding protein